MSIIRKLTINDGVYQIGNVIHDQLVHRILPVDEPGNWNITDINDEVLYEIRGQKTFIVEYGPPITFMTEQDLIDEIDRSVAKRYPLRCYTDPMRIIRAKSGLYATQLYTYLTSAPSAWATVEECTFSELLKKRSHDLLKEI